MTSALGFRVSKAVLSTIAPPIPLAYEWATRYHSPSPSRPLLDMSQGVPGNPPPDSVRQALGTAASSKESFGYGRWDGERSLREALVGEMRRVYSAKGTNEIEGGATDVDLRAEDVALTAGCNMAFMATAMSLADFGDEVILPVPWYFNHQMALNLLGVKAIGLPTHPEDGFMPSVERCAELVTSKTKAIVLVSPNNPTGAIYPPSLIASFLNLAREKNIALIIDETYRDFITTSSAPHHLFSSTNSSQPWRHTFIHLFSFSKSYCLPGHRLGAIVASPALLNSIKTILDTLQICPPRPVQMALAPLLPSLRGFLEANRNAISKRHKLFKTQLPKRWRIGAQGGFFAFVRHPFTGVVAWDVCRRLAVEGGVLTLPASFFRAEKPEVKEDVWDWPTVERNGEPLLEEDRWIRFSVANVDDEKVKRVCERLGECEEVFGWALEDLK
ncbi:pyridoxal phosphate-dependent transferase [Crassisporium funariophilum]|nr:pyridoxal phosphate-dependent transferase [Crassisporium funariophilum]